MGCQWIDDILDHGMLLNPLDTDVIETVKKLNSKLWLMSLNGWNQDCNPSVENIGKEMFLAMEILFPESDNQFTGLKIHEIELYETPNCYTTVRKESISQKERENFRAIRYDEIYRYYLDKGRIEYDSRKVAS